MSRPCPYCGQHPKLVDSAVIYGRSYGPAWLCQECWAWCGCHKGTNKPLGTLANEETRRLRKQVHAAFDPLWARRFVSRKRAYRLLAEKMGIVNPARDCHIGMFGADQCRKAMVAVKQIWVELAQERIEHEGRGHVQGSDAGTASLRSGTEPDAAGYGQPTGS